MSKNYLDCLSSESKNFAKESKEIFDIVIYGSAMKGKDIPRDIDIMVVFINLNLKDRLTISQKLKNHLRKKCKIENLDIKTININEIFNVEFLARQGFLIEGYSLLHKRTLAERIGFKAFSIFSYKLEGLNHNNKTRFTYALIGRKEEGILDKINAEHIGRGAVLVPIEKSAIFEDFLEEWKIKFEKKNTLISI